MTSWSTFRFFLCGVCVGIAFTLFYYRFQTAAVVWLVVSLVPMLPFHPRSQAEASKEEQRNKADRG
jgi:hypothetical protein